MQWKRFVNVKLLKKVFFLLNKNQFILKWLQAHCWITKEKMEKYIFQGLFKI